MRKYFVLVLVLFALNVSGLSANSQCNPPCSSNQTCIPRYVCEARGTGPSCESLHSGDTPICPAGQVPVCTGPQGQGFDIPQCANTLDDEEIGRASCRERV